MALSLTEDSMISSPASFPASRGSDPFTDELLDLPCLSLRCGDSTAAIAQQGAQLLSWRDARGRERLYLSPDTGGAKRDAIITSATLPPAIRGGMPVCFPQFSGRGPLPKHGFARAMRWTADEISGHSFPAQDSVASFRLRDDNCTQVIWPEAFLAQLQVLLEPDRLSVTLTLTNRGSTPWSFTGALHTYLRVRDIARTALAGLQDTRYQDATDGNREVLERDSAITVGGEIDRVYLSAPKSLQLIEDGKPSLRIEQTGFEDTVVWNPGPVLARSLKDFPDDDWRHMLCVEAACAATPVLVQPGSTWTGSQILSAT
jgi:glucose-6-phosphate 1-epimerase